MDNLTTVFNLSSSLMPSIYRTPSPSAVLYPVLTMEALLSSNTERRLFFKKIHRYVGMEDALYEVYYEPIFPCFVEYVQLFPDEPGGKAGGLMAHSLERAVAVLREYRQVAGISYSPLYAYVLFTAALFQNMGRLLSQHLCMISDAKGKSAQQWLLFKGSLVFQKAQHYKLYALENRWIGLGHDVTPLLARQCMPAAGFEWIASDYEVFRKWMDVLCGHEGAETAMLEWLHVNYPFIDKIPKKDQLDMLNIQLAKSKEAIVGEEFLAWLKKGLKDGTIVLNTAGAQVHVIGDNEILLGKELFRQFAQNQPIEGNWIAVCKQFNLLGLGANGNNGEFEQFSLKKQEAVSVENAKTQFGLFATAGLSASSSATFEAQRVRLDILMDRSPGVSAVMEGRPSINLSAMPPIAVASTNISQIAKPNTD